MFHISVIIIFANFSLAVVGTQVRLHARREGGRTAGTAFLPVLLSWQLPALSHPQPSA